MSISLPRPNADTKPYWEAAAQGRLIYQVCTACGHVQFYPRSFCRACQAGTLAWQESKRQGAIASFTEVMRAPSAGFKEMVPYVIALVDLDEGFRMMVNIVEGDRSKLAIGTRVHIVFRDVDGVTLPQGAVA